MFPTNRARDDQDPDTPTNHSASTQPARTGAAEQPSGNSQPRQPGTMPHRALTRELLLRPGLLALALVVVAVLGGILVSPAVATSQDVGVRQPGVAASTRTGPFGPSPATTQMVQADPSRKQPPLIAGQLVLQLLPDAGREQIDAGESVDYTARLLVRLGRYQGPINVTRWTGFGIQPDGLCEKARNKVSCTATKVGDYTVTATLPPGALPIVNFKLQAKATLRVIDPVVSLELKPAEATILEGDNQPYTAEGTTAAGRKVDVTGQTQFTISEPGKCSTDPRGRVSCTAEPGTYTVKGTLRQEGKDDLTDEAVLHVDPVVASLKLKPESVEIALGGSQPYTVEGFAADGRPVDLGEVTAKPVLSITQERQPSGDCKETTCIPAKLGEHTVTATLTQKGHPDLTAEAVLRVIDPVVSLELKPAEATILEGDNQPYTAEGTTAAGRKVDVTGQTQFTISEPGKCSTDPRGRVSCTAEPGTYTVKGTLRQEGKDDLTDEAVLHVDPVVASLKLKPESVEIALGGSQPYTVEGFAADGRPVDLGEVTAKPVLSITQERQPSGDCKETTCIPAKLGEHTVTATLTQKGHPDLTAEAVLRVIDPVVSLELKPAEATILEGDNQPYTAEGTTAAGRKVDVTGQTQFTISEPGKCSTDPRGRVSCTAEPGTYTVKGTLRQEGKDDLTDEAVLHVDPVVASLKLKPESVVGAEFVVGPGTGAAGGLVADLLHRRRIDRRGGVSPGAAHVGQRRGDLIVAQRRAERRHQADRFLPCRCKKDARERVDGAGRRWPSPRAAARPCPCRVRPADDRPDTGLRTPLCPRRTVPAPAA